MTHWNHRVLRQTHVLGDEEHVGFSVHEVFYDDQGVPGSWTEEAVGVAGDTWKEACDSHAVMGRAFSLPVLEVVDGKLVERSDRK